MSVLQFVQKNSFTKCLIGVFGLMNLVACQSTEELYVNKVPAKYHGLWQSNGYGYVIDARQSTIKSYHVTPDVCIQDNEIAEAFYHYANQQVEGGELVATEEGSALYFNDPFEDYTIQLVRLDDLPNVCHTPLKNTPKENYQAFTSYMSTHYAFFDLYKVNWPQVIADHQHRVTDDMSETALFELFSQMLEPIKDAHVSLQGLVDGKEKVYEPEMSHVGEATQKIAKELNTSKDKIDEKFFEQYWLQDIQADILKNKGIMAADGWIQYGITEKDIGYMAIASAYGYAGEGINSHAQDRQQLTQVLDRALILFNQRNVKAIIIDLSINIGGHSFPATDIASRFAEQATFAFAKKAYDANGLADFPIHIVPSQGPHFYGPVYVLAANTTVSGGEEMVLALKALPNVTLVGERTRGALSDILSKSLPNGWNLAISNEIYTDNNGVIWEGDGIQPDIEIPVFDRINPFTGHLDAIKQVIQFMR